MRRPFSPDSHWNQAIPPDAAIDPDSDGYVRMLASGDGSSPFHLNMDRFTIPVYQVDANTPQRPVIQKQSFCNYPQHDPFLLKQRSARYGLHPDFPDAIPAPEHAIPDPSGDHHLCIVDESRRLAWDLWAAQERRDGAIEAYCGMPVDLDGPGVWNTDDFPIQNGESIHFHGPCRAAGTPLLAGLIMQHEIEAGRIEHKLAFACWQCAVDRFCFPACWTDGFRAWGLPQGATLQLDPGLDLDAFDLSPAARVIARAMQDYGLVNVDNAGGSCLYAEGLYGHPGRSWEGLLEARDLAKLPVTALRVLQLEDIQNGGDDQWYRSRQSRGEKV